MTLDECKYWYVLWYVFVCIVLNDRYSSVFICMGCIECIGLYWSVLVYMVCNGLYWNVFVGIVHMVCIVCLGLVGKDIELDAVGCQFKLYLTAWMLSSAGLPVARFFEKDFTQQQKKIPGQAVSSVVS